MMVFDEFVGSIRSAFRGARGALEKLVVTRLPDGNVEFNENGFILPKSLVLPNYSRERIFGTENEYGVVGVKEELLPKLGFVSNGGRVYLDCGHIEYASPETRNPLEAVIWNKAGELICKSMTRKLYKNNVAEDNDGVFVSFGAHENYFTKMNMAQSVFLAPFLATRQIFAGSGWLKPNGEYEISQKSDFIYNVLSGNTTGSRAIINTKREDHSSLEGWRRLHLILGDANMNEVAEFMKLGTTGLVLDLFEDGKFPAFTYGNDEMVGDLKKMSKLKEGWNIRLNGSAVKATDVQRAYLNEARKIYSGRDQVTDRIIGLWGDTLDKLDRDPMELVGRVDWVTKKALIDGYASANNIGMDSDVLRNIDLQYHDTDRETSIFYALQKQGKVERLVTDEMIEHAARNPPRTTRAWIRGNVIRLGEEAKNAGSTSHSRADWTYVESGKVISQCPQCSDSNCSGTKKNIQKYNLHNPFDSYDSALKKCITDMGAPVK